MKDDKKTAFRQMPVLRYAELELTGEGIRNERGSALPAQTHNYNANMQDVCGIN